MILVINTAGGGIELALNSRHEIIPTEKQSVALGAETEKFISACGAKWSDLSAIAVVVGPGSFTGIRLGIAYAKGLGIGLNIPVVPINAFELYLADTPDAFVAIESGRGDFFVGATNLPPQTMEIEEVETRQMAWPRTVGHRPFNIMHAVKIAEQKIAAGNTEPVVPMYLRKSYAEEARDKKNDIKR